MRFVWDTDNVWSASDRRRCRRINAPRTMPGLGSADDGPNREAHAVMIAVVAILQDRAVTELRFRSLSR